MLKQRVLTAMVLAPIALIGVFASNVSQFVYFLAFIILLAAWEWADLSSLQKTPQRLIYVLTIALAVFVLNWFYAYLPVENLLLLSVLAWLIALFWVVCYPRVKSWQGQRRRLCIGLVVLLSSWLAFMELKAGEEGELHILLLFLLVWGADVGAYFTGKKLGNKKLAPRVSPGKTREGLYGGLATCLLVALLYALYASFSLTQTLLLLVVSLTTGLTSVLGDLFESMLKRYRGVKDSGQLLPGHGGVLDRIDSLTAAAPVFVLGMHYMVLA